MHGSDPRSWAASFLGFALTVLAACAALSFAVHLLMDIWREIAVIGGVIALVLALGVFLRYLLNRHRW